MKILVNWLGDYQVFVPVSFAIEYWRIGDTVDLLLNLDKFPARKGSALSTKLPVWKIYFGGKEVTVSTQQVSRAKGKCMRIRAQVEQEVDVPSELPIHPTP